MEIKEYNEKYNAITKVLMGYVTEEKKGENILLSPMSIIMLLGIAADAVRGPARDEILNVVGSGDSYDEIIAVLKRIQENSKRSDSLMSSNAVCVKESISGSIISGYPAHLREIFDGNLFTSSDMVQSLNEWVTKKTKGMITDAADESMNQMLACLVNAIAFESEWQEQYENDDIHEGYFKNADGTISKVQMMESSEDTYIEDDYFSGFIKPYVDDKYAFMALLPKKKGSRSFLLKAIEQMNFTKLLDEAVSGTVYVTMPEFKSDFKEDLTGLCKKLGIITLFSQEADFSPMSSEWLKVDSIVHKAHIEVDRKGTKAAAVTMAYVVAGCAPSMDYKSVCLDRPFIYAVIDVETGLQVFTGIYNQAEKEENRNE